MRPNAWAKRRHRKAGCSVCRLDAGRLLRLRAAYIGWAQAAFLLRRYGLDPDDLVEHAELYRWRATRAANTRGALERALERALESGATVKDVLALTAKLAAADPKKAAELAATATKTAEKSGWEAERRRTGKGAS